MFGDPRAGKITYDWPINCPVDYYQDSALNCYTPTPRRAGMKCFTAKGAAQTPTDGIF